MLGDVQRTAPEADSQEGESYKAHVAKKDGDSAPQEDGSARQGQCDPQTLSTFEQNMAATLDKRKAAQKKPSAEAEAEEDEEE